MTSLKEIHETPIDEKNDSKTCSDQNEIEVSDLPPTGISLHKRRRGEAPASLTVKTPSTLSDAEGSSQSTAGPTSDDYWSIHDENLDAEALCDSMLQKLKDQDDAASARCKDLAVRTKGTMEALNQLEKLLELLDQFLSLKEHHDRLLRKLKDVDCLKRLHEVHKKISIETENIKDEARELEAINEAIDTEIETEYGEAIFDSIMAGSRIMKRAGSKLKSHSRFGGSLLRKQRARSAGGEDSDASPGTPLRRRSEGVFLKEVEKSKVSKWTKVKAAFRWEKAQWPPSIIGGAAGAVAAGALVGAVALAGSSPVPHTLNPDIKDSASLTPGSALSLTPNSSCEELRLDSSMCRKSTGHRCDDNDNTFLHAPTQDDSSTSPSPNKLHKTPWGKMRDMIQTHRDSVKKKTIRGSKTSPDMSLPRRRSLSDGGDSDAPPALTLTIPSSEELESEPSHPLLQKQRSLELGTKPPQHRPPRASKWTKVKKAFLTSASASVPSSPNRHSAFFTDVETEAVSSGCEAAGGDRDVREEIARDYAALQLRLRREFTDRRASRPVATEEQLSADFRKKLAEWQRRKGARQPPPAPARQDLSEDFLKKWDEWKRMKETNSVPAWEEEAKPDEVLVQTSTGLFKFQGISRSFTRKLHEWEKSRGIAPEASTSALLQAARGRRAPAPTATHAPNLTRTRSFASLDADTPDLDSDFDPDQMLEGVDDYDGEDTRGAVLVEVEAEEICTAAPLVAVSPRHTPQKPVYTYGHAEARLLCETSSAITGSSILQPNGAVVIPASRSPKNADKSETKPKTSREQCKPSDKNIRKKIIRQPSIEEDAKFIRKTIEEIERGSSSRFKVEQNISVDSESNSERITNVEVDMPATNKSNSKINQIDNYRESNKNRDVNEDEKRKELEKCNGKKKGKSRARLEREQSKPSESDSEQDVDTVTVEIPRRRKRPRKASERPRTPPVSLQTDSEQEVFVLKLKTPNIRGSSPEVIVKTTRKIFSPVVRCGESVPTAVIPVDVEDLVDVRKSKDQDVTSSRNGETNIEKQELNNHQKNSCEAQDIEDQKPKNRPPLPSSPSSQRKPQPKETSPSIRIMIQRYNKKINEEGHTSGASSGTSSPAWRSPTSERRRPPDMPVGVNIRNNPFVEKEVLKSASASQLSRRDHTSLEKQLELALQTSQDKVLKSHSAHALNRNQFSTDLSLHKPIKSTEDIQDSTQDSTSNNSGTKPEKNLASFCSPPTTQSMCILRQISDKSGPNSSSLAAECRQLYERSSTLESTSNTQREAEAVKLSERAARIRAARERFLSSPISIRREGTSSTSDLRPGDRSSRVSCESDVTETHGTAPQEAVLGRSASTGMVNVDRDAWQRLAEGTHRENRARSRFSLARLAARLRGKEESTVSRLCRQSLLVQLRNKH